MKLLYTDSCEHTSLTLVFGHVLTHTHTYTHTHTTYLHSIEEDFVTWKEELWPAVCEQFGVDSSQQDAMAREYQVTIHTDLPKEKVFVGEPHRLGSYENQKPYVGDTCVMSRVCLLYTSPSPRDATLSRMPSSA